MAPQYKLTYFNITGLAESIRMILKYGGIDFEDERFEREQWPEYKSKMPFGQVPVLTVNGRQYHQSVAIARFCAKQAKLVGKDDLENLEIDGVVETIVDLIGKNRVCMQETDETKKEQLKKTLYGETIPYYLQRFDNLAQTNGGYLACNKLTWADFYLIGLLFHMNKTAEMDLIEKYPHLKQMRSNVVNIPQVKKWIDERPQ